MNFGNNRVQTNTMTSLDLLNNGALVRLATSVLLVMQHLPYTMHTLNFCLDQTEWNQMYQS